MNRGALALVAVSAIARADTGLQVVHDRLPNGLAVVLAPDARASSVVIEVRYAAGAADEAALEAGYAHVVERLLAAPEVDARIDAVGGWTTSEAAVAHVRTVIDVPPGAVETALGLEAERMRTLPDAIDARALERASAAIAAERHAAYEDHPYGLVARAVQQALWSGGPNAHLVLATSRATPEAIAAFARRWFGAGHAVLVVAGRFDLARVQQLVRDDFARVPAGPTRAAEPVAPPPLEAPSELHVADPIAKAVIAFRAPAAFAPDEAALEVAARIAARAANARVEYRRQTGGGELQLVAEGDPDALVKPLRAALAAVRAAPPSSDDLERAVAGLELESMLALEAIPLRADALASAPDPIHARRAALHAVTPASVQLAARHWLAESAAVTVLARPEAP